MQYKDDKTRLLAEVTGKVIKDLRQKDSNRSINKFAREYDLDIGNTSRIEKGLIDVKFVTLWKIAEALGIAPSKLVRNIEAKIGRNFHFYEE